MSLIIEDYSNSEFELTENESIFIKVFLSNNGCGAETPEALLNDNFSCQCLEDLRELFSGLSNNEIGGYLSSLQEKSVIWLEERDGSICKSNNRMARLTFEPDLYWVDDSYLESLKADVNFYKEVEGARKFL